MTTPEMDPQLAREVRAELTAVGTKHSRLQRHQQRVRALTVGIGILAIAGATTAAAIVVNNIPGSTTVAPLGGISTATHTGTGTIDLGPAPAKARAVILNFNCLNQQGTVSIDTNPQNSGSGGTSPRSTARAGQRQCTSKTDSSRSRAAPRSPSQRTLAPDGKLSRNTPVPPRPAGA